MVVQNRFSELLAHKARIENRTISRRIVAEETGISVTSIQNWATNSIQRFDALQIATFCKYFDCTVAELLVIAEDENELEPTLVYAT